MTKLPIIILALAAGFGVSACDRNPGRTPSAGPGDTVGPVPRTKTLETGKLGAAIDVYERTPNSETTAQVKKAFADLESEIAELAVDASKRSGGPRDEAVAKQRNLETYRDAEQLRFTKAQAAAGLSGTTNPPVTDNPPVDSVENKARRAGETIEDAARKAGNVIKEGADKIGEAVKDAAR